MRRLFTPVAAGAAAAALAIGLPATAASALGGPDPAPSPRLAARPAPPPETTSAGTPVDLDLLFVGAHPDDESGLLSAIGRADAEAQLRTGVVTITRGEGGGNAVGPEEGPALGLVREAEERRAVGAAGVDTVVNLDQVDFFYTVSAPLTAQVWDHDDTLARVVRTVRQTRPEVMITMNPTPSPGNHGNHQEAARLAIEAFRAAADPEAFPEQITDEHLEPWAPSRVLLNTVFGTRALGPTCPVDVTLEDPAQTVYGIWSGERAPDGRTWAQVERDAQRQYASQGWSVFPDAPTDPAQIGCDYLTQVASRVPSPEPGTPEAASPGAALQGALVRAPGSVPLGTGLEVTSDHFRVVAGASTSVTATVHAGTEGLGAAGVALQAPEGWRVDGLGDLGQVAADGSARASFTVTAPADAAPEDRVRLAAELTSDAGTGWAATEVAVSAPLRAVAAPLPRVEQFQEWAVANDVPQLQGFVTPVTTVASGGSEELGVDVANVGDVVRSGTVELDLPDGFSSSAAVLDVPPLAPGETTRLETVVSSTDAGLPTSNAGGTPGAAPGDHAYALTATSAADGSGPPVEGTTRPALELVPTTTVPQVDVAPEVDGVEAPGEYPGATLDLSRRWEGDDCASAADCSATGKLAWHDDALSVLVTVTDDTRGTALAASDCKRHWRTDSVEIALDPRGSSENTSTTFKAAVLPFTAEGGLCYLRDADNRQGPGEATAPGMQVASTSTDAGYAVETTIPLALLPAAVDPEHLGVDLFVYDSDTRDRTGQTRLGWSTWGGVQGDPYRWGVATLPGYAPPAGRAAEPAAPGVPTEALSSLDSPQTIAQSVRQNLPLAGGPAAPAGERGWLTRAARCGGDLDVSFAASGPGAAHGSYWQPATETERGRVLASGVTAVPPGDQRRRFSLPAGVGQAPGAVGLVAFEARGGGTLSSMATVHQDC